MKKQGFALLIVLILLSLALLASVSVWQSSLLLRDYAHERTLGMRKKNILQSIALYTKHFCDENWARLQAKAKKDITQETLMFTDWFTDGLISYGARIELTLTEQHILATLFLLEGHRTCDQLNLLMIKTSDGITISRPEKA